MKIKPYPFQEEAIEKTFDWFRKNTNPNKHPIIKIATGGGKSVVVAEFVRRIVTQWKDQRILVVTASKELISQNYQEMKTLFPECDAGLYCAGLGVKQPHKQVVFGTIGSVAKKAFQIGFVSIILVDECHGISTKKDVGLYRQMLAEFAKINPKVRIIGLTATDFRGNGVLLTEGEGALFTETIVDVGIRELLDGGFLAPLVLKETATRTDVTGVHISKLTGDYNIGELAKAVDRDEVTKSIVSEIISAAGSDRKKWMIFGIDIAHCNHLHEELAHCGIHGGVVTGKTPKAQRDRIISQFKNGHIKYLVSCETLTTGFNVKDVDLLALARPTKSPVLFLQISGRGLRTAPNKKDCLFLDFTDTTETLGSIDTIKGRRENKNKKDGTPILKKCPICGVHCAPSATLCECGHTFEINRKNNVNEVSSDAPILSTQTNNLFQVESWQPKAHAKLGSPASMQVSYFAGNTSVGNLTAITTHSHREWVCFDHEGFARRKAESWWLKMGGSLPYPVDVKDAITRFSELTKPDEIQLKKEGKYYVITNHYFKQQPAISVAPAAIVPEIHHAIAETTSDTFSANDVRPSVSSAFSRALSAM
jgi:DNA repair protein RadD